MSNEITNRRNKYKGVGRQYKEPLRFNLDIVTVNKFCSYALSENKSIHSSAESNLLLLLKSLGPDEVQPGLENRLHFCIDVLTFKLTQNIHDRDLVLRSILGLVGNKYEGLDVDSFKEIDDGTVKWVEESTSLVLNTRTVNNAAFDVQQACQDYIHADLNDKQKYGDILRNKIIDLNNTFRRNTPDLSSMENKFLLSEAKDPITNIITRKRNPSSKLVTGMQAFNVLLAGGFEGGRVYCLFGLPGEGKTTTLLNLTYQLKKHNARYICKDRTKRPCIVFFTMENSVREAVQTIYNISAGPEDISGFTTEEVLANMAKGGLKVDKESPIEVYMEFQPVFSKDTNYLYQLTDDLGDMGLEVIAVVFDYIKRIKPVERADSDERFRLGQVINELKTFATLKDIPVITASQLNREGARTVDNRRETNKSDIVASIGRGMIGESSLIDENLDATIFIVPQYVDNKKYMGFKWSKHRYKAPKLNDKDIFYQPFYDDNPVKFVEDLGLSEPVYKESLMSNREDIAKITGENRFASSQKVDDLEELDTTMMPSVDLFTPGEKKEKKLIKFIHYED